MVYFASVGRNDTRKRLFEHCCCWEKNYGREYIDLYSDPPWTLQCLAQWLLVQTPDRLADRRCQMHGTSSKRAKTIRPSGKVFVPSLSELPVAPAHHSNERARRRLSGAETRSIVSVCVSEAYLGVWRRGAMSQCRPYDVSKHIPSRKHIHRLCLHGE